MIKLGHFGTEPVLADEAEIQCHQQLHNLYNSTRAAKVESRWSFSFSSWFSVTNSRYCDSRIEFDMHCELEVISL